MDLNFYRFESVWSFAHPVERVYLALAHLDDYPHWWPEVRTVRPVDETSRRITCRSVLPYSLCFLSRAGRQDPDAGILEARLSGDLTDFPLGLSRHTPEGCRAVFAEEVTAKKGLLRKLALVARPAFRVNHSLIMSHGRRGLNAYLAGMRSGRHEPNSDQSVPAERSPSTLR